MKSRSQSIVLNESNAVIFSQVDEAAATFHMTSALGMFTVIYNELEKTNVMRKSYYFLLLDSNCMHKQKQHLLFNVYTAQTKTTFLPINMIKMSASNRGALQLHQDFLAYWGSKVVLRVAISSISISIIVFCFP